MIRSFALIRGLHFMLRSGRLTQLVLRSIDSAIRLLPHKDSGPEHLRTGRRGEEEAYFYLRRQGYVIIARNYRSPRSRSELDLVGWDGEILCFIEVKTRTTRDIQPAEVAVDPEKRRDLSRVARDFLLKMTVSPSFRFDIVSVYFEAGQETAIELFRNAFPRV
jgi:putative endonuclease